jgi:hypothetical protein
LDFIWIGVLLRPRLFHWFEKPAIRVFAEHGQSGAKQQLARHPLGCAGKRRDPAFGPRSLQLRALPGMGRMDAPGNRAESALGCAGKGRGPAFGPLSLRFRALPGMGRVVSGSLGRFSRRHAVVVSKLEHRKNRIDAIFAIH